MRSRNAIDALFPTSPMFDSIEIVRAPEPVRAPAPKLVVVCECDHSEASHADPDYDFDGCGYVEGPRPCLIPGCSCERFFE
jgi:hypothetical protein